MAYRASVTYHGNQTLHESFPSRPIVTLAIIAYNQEEYIRDAICSAFAQSYSPLEIIVSDDCSRDKTYDIIKEMASEYHGPHKIIACQTSHNLGLIRHVLLTGREATGQIVVLAAGDDKSRPERTERLVEAFNDNSVYGVSTAYDLIDEAGKTLAANLTDPVIKSSLAEQQNYFLGLKYPYVVIQGSTSCYRREVFELPLPTFDLTFAEDNLFNFMIYAHGYRVRFINESLVEYRTHNRALGNRQIEHKDTASEEVAIRDAAVEMRNKMDTFIWIANNHNLGERVNIARLHKSREQAEIIESWPMKRYSARFASVMQSLIRFEREMLRWKFSRLLGAYPFYQPRRGLKYLINLKT